MYNPRDFIFDPKKKAIRHVDDDLEILKFKDDEIQRLSNGKIELESSDAFERMFWEMDIESLKRLKEDYKRILKGNKKVLFALVHSIDKVISQRKFMQENKAFRDALLPE